MPAAAYAGAISFPEIVGLLGAGFESCAVDHRTRTATHVMSEGQPTILDIPAPEWPVAAGFDAAAVAAAIRSAQAAPADDSDPAFCEAMAAAGCAGHVVSVVGRRVLSYGRNAKTHVEPFPP